jgi:hypothetical protein
MRIRRSGISEDHRDDFPEIKQSNKMTFIFRLFPPLLIVSIIGAGRRLSDIFLLVAFSWPRIHVFVYFVVSSPQSTQWGCGAGS